MAKDNDWPKAGGMVYVKSPYELNFGTQPYGGHSSCRYVNAVNEDRSVEVTGRGQNTSEVYKLGEYYKTGEDCKAAIEQSAKQLETT